MKLTVAQMKVVETLRDFHRTYPEQDGMYGPVFEKEFNKKTIDNLLEKGVVVRESRSRLRQDDMEMIYWDIYRLATTKLEQAMA